MKSILVTGCAGFIGSKTAQFLLEDGVNIVGIDNMNDYYDVRLKKHRLSKLLTYNNFKFYPCDIENYGALEVLFHTYSFDAVINLAARAGVRYSLVDPFVYMNTNANGVLNLLELMRLNNVKKMVHASTSSLYAGQKMPFTEALPVNTPISPYAASKKASEAICYTYHNYYGLDVSILRYFTVYGPAGRPDMSILRFIKWIDNGTAIELFGDGTQSRDFTYIDDIARGSILALKEIGYEIINIGGGQNPLSINRLIEEIEKNLNKKGTVNYQPFHKADMMETWADISKANNILEWSPQTAFEEGIKNSVNWYLENHELMKDLKL